MTVNSIDVVYKCWLHGTNIQTVEIGGIMWCSKCLREMLERHRVHKAEMVRIERHVEEGFVKCPHCGKPRKNLVEACDICGFQ